MASKSEKSNATEVKKQRCTCCGQEKDLSEYYISTNILYSNFKRLSVCKDCVVDTIYNSLLDEIKDEVGALYELCRLTNSYFEEFLYNSAKAEANNKSGKQSNPIRIYFTKINSLPQYRMKTFKHSVSYGKVDEKQEEKVIEISLNDKKNEEDILRLLGYDPFASENLEDKPYLYNKLCDYIDESVLEDAFKLSSCIELVKMFNQIDKINTAIAIISSDVEKIASNVGGVKSLIEAKEKLYSSALKLAKDNGISLLNNNNKSKGSGTLSGIVKKLDEIGLESAELNLFNIETAQAMKQVADLSHQSILEQLMLNESDYTEMITTQKDMLKKLNEKVNALEEENRLLKIKISRENIE